MPSDRLVSLIGAVLSAYAAVIAVVLDQLVFVGPFAALFVLGLFCAQAGEPFVGDVMDVLHAPKFSAGEPLNTTQQIGEGL